MVASVEATYIPLYLQINQVVIKVILTVTLVQRKVKDRCEIQGAITSKAIKTIKVKNTISSYK